MKKIIILLILILFASTAYGSYISIGTQLKSSIIHKNSTEIIVNIEQMGDESAYKVEIEPFSSEYFEINGEIKKDSINPGDKINGSLSVSLKNNITEGNYPFLIKTIYHDANMYPFSVISPHTITYRKGYESSIHGTFEKIEVSKDDSEKTSLKIRNFENDQKEIKIKLYLPREIKGDESEKYVTLGPKEEKEIEYEIESFGALPGSSYVIITSLEYEKSGYHYTSFGSGVVSIVEKKEQNNLILILASIFFVLFAIFLYFKFGGRKK